MIAHVHECCVCQSCWQCDGVGRGPKCEVLKAVEVNKTGPYCSGSYLAASDLSTKAIPEPGGVATANFPRARWNF